jgi:molybdopterin converting factor small subunit
MLVQILAFGIAKEIVGNTTIEVELNEHATIGDLKVVLENRFQRLKQLASYMIAQGNEYASDHDKIIPENEIALIPPVSGG